MLSSKSLRVFLLTIAFAASGAVSIADQLPVPESQISITTTQGVELLRTAEAIIDYGH
ncbi:MAG: hypothetical protein R3C13_07480 [Hyphomonas sp.]|uniref:hypothetical protein n=1 Tax=Hyphomonas sp. TaxID=87 RepID=UPI003526E4BC